MEEKVRIIFPKLSVTALLNQTHTASELVKILPVESRVQRWGKEIYFKIPLKVKLEKSAREEVEQGEIAYWPLGACFCIFFGKTPASVDEKPKAYSPVNVIGKLCDFDPEQLDSISENEPVRVERVE